MRMFKNLESFTYKSLESITFMSSCNGMCKRILKDIEDSSHDNDYLLEAYFNEINHGGMDYSPIIKLGKLLEELEKGCKQWN